MNLSRILITYKDQAVTRFFGDTMSPAVLTARLTAILVKHPNAAIIERRETVNQQGWKAYVDIYEVTVVDGDPSEFAP